LCNYDKELMPYKKLILVPKLSNTDRVPGGVENYYKVLRFDQLDNIDYLEINANSDKESFLSMIIRMIRIYASFFYLVSSRKYDKVLLNPSLDNRSFYRDAIFLMIAHFYKLHTIVFFRSWHNEFEEKVKSNWFEIFLFRKIYTRSYRFIVLGTVFKDKLIKLGIPSAKILIESTLANDSFLTSLDMNRKLDTYEKKVSILFLARLKKGKGLILALEAYLHARKKLPERAMEFIVAGGGPELTEAKEFVESNQIPDVQFLGFVSGKQKAEVLVKSHIMLFPTHYDREGLPNAILEGMLYGLAIISRPHVGIPDVVTHGINGYLSDSLKYDIFTEFLKDVVSDKNLFETMIQANHEKAKNTFTREIVKGRLVRILNDEPQYFSKENLSLV